MRAGIVIDRWKLPIFTRHLKEAGFSYEEVGPFTEDTLTLIVDVEPKDRQRLGQVVLAANTEAARVKGKT